MAEPQLTLPDRTTWNTALKVTMILQNVLVTKPLASYHLSKSELLTFSWKNHTITIFPKTQFLKERLSQGDDGGQGGLRITSLPFFISLGL